MKIVAFVAIAILIVGTIATMLAVWCDDLDVGPPDQDI